MRSRSASRRQMYRQCQDGDGARCGCLWKQVCGTAKATEIEFQSKGDRMTERPTKITVEKWQTIAEDVAAGRCQVIEPESNEIVVACSLGYGPDSYVGYVVTK